MSDFPELDELLEKCDYDTKLAVVAWVFKHIVDHAEQGGTFRYLIYDRLGFSPDAYVPLYEAGGMDISNEFRIQTMEEIRKIVVDQKIEPLKRAVDLCDEPNCFDDASCGTPTKEKYRWTCFDHRPMDDK